ncbi:MAG: amino acid--tRNA ligase-related protein, partial [bacterium]
KQPIRRMGYDEAMLRFGSDKPDTRFGLEIEDVSDIAEKSDFNVFSGTVEKGGAVRCLYVPGGGELSRKDIDNLTELAKKYGAKGLAQCKFVDGEFSGGIAKFLGENEKAEFVKRFSPEDGSIFMFVADKPLVCARTLGAIRLEMGKRFDLIDKSKWDMLFVVDFPMFEFDEESGRPVAQHHAFTMVRPEDVDKLESDPMAVRSVAYDLVLNGHEIAGGSIRTHDPEVLRRVMKAIKLSDEEADEKFGFLMEAMKYGAPPHGGIAFGWDRIIMLLAGMDSIRDVIAFPKTTAAQSLMDGCPNDVDLKQLEELGIKLIKEGK